jgi:hypothetical protein
MTSFNSLHDRSSAFRALKTLDCVFNSIRTQASGLASWFGRAAGARWKQWSADSEGLAPDLVNGKLICPCPRRTQRGPLTWRPKNRRRRKADEISAAASQPCLQPA